MRLMSAKRTELNVKQFWSISTIPTTATSHVPRIARTLYFKRCLKRLPTAGPISSVNCLALSEMNLALNRKSTLCTSTIFQIHLVWHRARVSERLIRHGSTSRPGLMAVETKQRLSLRFTVKRWLSFIGTKPHCRKPHISTKKFDKFLKNSSKQSENKTQPSAYAKPLIYTIHMFIFSYFALILTTDRTWTHRTQLQVY